ncbi:MAG: hypothetical protein WEC73_03255 [Chthoniobacterales bacterium]
MPEDAPTLDLSALDFRPAWAKDPSAAPSAPQEFREPRPERGPFQRPGFPRGGKPGGKFDGPRRGGPKPHGKKFDGPRRDDGPPAPPPPNPFPWLRIAFTATVPAVETVAQQIRHTGKTFSLFDIARILLRNPASYTIDLTSAPKQTEGPFYIVDVDHSVWLKREAAVRHLLNKKRDELYRAETVEIEPPKGNFPVVAVCGMSGALLGPPNHHDFERKLRDLHRERFARLDFETFRARLKMERDPEVIEKWRAAASRAVEYFPREGENPEKLMDPAAVERHFDTHHAAAHIKFVDLAPVPGNPKTTAVDPALAPLLNHARDEEERFPLRLAQSLSRALSGAGLRFYKTPNRTTFVSAARPRHLNLEEVPVSDSIKKILELIRSKKSLRRAQLVNLLAPPNPNPPPVAAPSPAPVVSPAPEPPLPPAAPTTSEPASPPTEPDAPSNPPPSNVAAPSPAPAVPSDPPSSPTHSPSESEAPAPVVPPDPAREAIVNDLLWLTHEGYVIEFADGRLESVPPPKHPPKAPPAEEAPVETPADSAPAAPEETPPA